MCAGFHRYHFYYLYLFVPCSLESEMHSVLHYHCVRIQIWFQFDSDRILSCWYSADGAWVPSGIRETLPWLGFPDRESMANRKSSCTNWPTGAQLIPIVSCQAADPFFYLELRRLEQVLESDHQLELWNVMNGSKPNTMNTEYTQAGERLSWERH